MKKYNKLKNLLLSSSSSSSLRSSSCRSVKKEFKRLEPYKTPEISLKGFKLVLKGRLYGSKRTRKDILSYNGVSPNTITSKIKQYQTPINTK